MSLHEIIPATTSLLSYLNRMLDRVEERASCPLLKFMSSIKILPEASPPQCSWPVPDPTVNMRDLLNRFISIEVKQNRDFRSTNCLCFGYKLKTALSASEMRSDLSTECYFVNTIHSLLYTHDWQELARLVGEIVMRHLLSRPMFVYMDNGCYVQVSGIPISELIKNEHRGCVQNKFSSHQKLLEHYKGSIPGSTEIPRFRIFYNLTCDRFIGLPRKHLFHKPITPELLADCIFMNSREANGCWAGVLAMLEKVQRTYIGLDIRFLFGYYHHNQQQQPDVQVSEQNYDQQTTSTGPAVSITGDLVAKKSKRQRGTRAGQHVQQRRPINSCLKKTCASGPIVDKHMIHSAASGLARSIEFASLTNSSRCHSTAMTLDVSRKRSREHATSPSPSISLTESALARCPSPRPSSESFSLVSSASPSFARSAVISSVSSPGSVTVGNKLKRRMVRFASRAVEISTTGNISQQSLSCSGSEQSSGSCGQLYSVLIANEDQSTINDCGASNNFSLRKLMTMESQTDDDVSKSSSQFQSTGRRNTSIRSASGVAATKMVPNNAVKGSKKRKHNDSIISDYGTAGLWLRLIDPQNGDVVKERPQAPIVPHAGDHSPILECAPKSAPNQIDYLSLQCPHNSVAEFVKSVCRRCFSVELVWGSRHNLKCFMAAIDLYIRLGRQETLNVSQVLFGVRISELPWLSLPKRTGISGGSPTIDASAIMRAFSHWIFSDFINPLLCSCYYITEGEGCGNTTLYYRKAVWKELMKIGREQMSKNFVEVVSPAVAASTQTAQIGYSLSAKEDNWVRNMALLPSIRFVPKRYSVRAITNFRLNIPQKSLSSFDNNLLPSMQGHALYNCLHVLKAICHSRPSLLGFGCSSVDQACSKLRQFRANTFNATIYTSAEVDSNGRAPDVHADSSANASIVRLASPTVLPDSEDSPKFYVVSLDIDKCYDNIDTKRLFDILKSILYSSLDIDTDGGFDLADLEEDLMIRKYSVTSRISSIDRSVSRTLRHVSTAGDVMPIKDIAKAVCGYYPNSVISDAVVYSKLSTNELLKSLRYHLFSHVVKLPSVVTAVRGDDDGKRSHKYTPFSQVTGIPQGSLLSPILCNIYYGHCEREIFGAATTPSCSCESNLFDDQKSIVLRLVDDYLFISTDRVAAQRFLQLTHTVLPLFGGDINPAKTKVNFDASIELNGNRVSVNRFQNGVLHWCGILLDSRSLEVRPSFSRLLEMPLSSSCSIDCNWIGDKFKKTIKSFIRTKSNPIFLASDVNKFETKIEVVHSIILLTAVRVHFYLRNLKHRNIQLNSSFVVISVIEALVFASRQFMHFCQYQHRSQFGIASKTFPAVSEICTNTPEKSLLVPSVYCMNMPADSSQVQFNQKHMMWVGLRAFHAVFSKFPGLYSAEICQLRQHLDIHSRQLAGPTLHRMTNILRACV